MNDLCDICIYIYIYYTLSLAIGSAFLAAAARLLFLVSVRRTFSVFGDSSASCHTAVAFSKLRKGSSCAHLRRTFSV